MITYINKANADKYRVLFSDAVRALQTHDVSGKEVGSPGAGDPVIKSEPSYEVVKVTAETFEPGVHYKSSDKGVSWEATTLEDEFDPALTYGIQILPSEAISTLEEYFSYIADLCAISRRYTILPLDEEYFFINANTRQIEVPRDFRTNGVAVQGDEIAEILYFKINRFFDMDDLATKDIFIEWRAPADSEGHRAEGVSIPWVTDIESCPGYIIFGWPLASEITSIPGRVDFGVRFYTYDDDEKKLQYSFSTLTQNVEIKQGLAYDVETILLDESSIVDSDDLITNRLVNSQIDDPSMPDPLTPTITDEIIREAHEYNKQNGERGEKDIYNIYLTDPKTGAEKDAYFLVQATTNDTGVISYTWVKKDELGDLAMVSLKSEIIFEPTDDEARDKNKIYYQKDTSKGEIAYVPYQFDGDETLSDVQSPKSYDEPWDGGEEGTPDPRPYGKGITLYERFTKVTMNHDGANVLGTYQCRITNRVGRKTARAFSNIALVQGPTDPEITTDITAGSGIFDEEGNTVNLTVTATTDPHSYVTYEWMRSDDGQPDTFELFEEPTTTNVKVVTAKEYGQDDDGDGFYKVIVKSFLNDTTESVESGVLRVTHAAEPVDIEQAPGDLPNGAYDINKPLSITATPNEHEKRTDADSITYQWYRYEGKEGQLSADLTSAAQGTYKVTDADKPVIDANKNTVQITNTEANENGYYFCEVTNTYNGTTAVKCSPFFNVVDTRVGN